MTKYDGLSREYALSQIDKWYSSRVKRALSRDTIERVRGILLESIGNMSGIDREDRAKIAGRIIDTVNIDFLEERSKTMFCRSYSEIETLSETLKDTSLSEDRKKRIREVMETGGNEIMDFVGRVRRRSDEIMPDELTFKDIDNAFIEVYGGSRGYNEVGRKRLASIIDSLKNRVPKDEEDRKRTVFLLELYHGQIEILTALNNLVFGDLEERAI